MIKAEIGIIGGSGLYKLDRIGNIEEVNVSTPFGYPSDTIIVGELEGVGVAFLARHGRGHFISPTDVPSRANIYALKYLGVRKVIAVSAVGSLLETIKPLEFVAPDQVIDRTTGRQSTFFEKGIVAHVGFADPFCPQLRRILVDHGREVGLPIHETGTYVSIEGPSFSTRAESHLSRSWGGSVIGMTALPEAKLAREAELCYCMLACVTDYDVWREGEEDVSVQKIIANLEQNVAAAQSILAGIVPLLKPDRSCRCQEALKDAIVTSPTKIPTEVRDKLKVIVGDRLA